jgi:RNA polymerase sigma-70 factor (ECF subfamily)
MVVSEREREISPEALEACRRGDREAFRALYEAYKDRVYSLAFYMLGGDRAGASDITQQVFVKLLTSLSQFRGDARFSTWLHRLVVNACLDGRRSAERRQASSDPALLEALVAPHSPHLDLAQAERSAAVQRALSQLAPPFRMVILLRYFEERSYEDIAAVLNCSVGTVASRLNRAHRVLAKLLAPVRVGGGMP